MKESRGGGETRFGCHWLCQCSFGDVAKRFSTGRASGTQNETVNVLFFKSLVAFRFREKTFVRGANNDYPQQGGDPGCTSRGSSAASRRNHEILSQPRSERRLSKACDLKVYAQTLSDRLVLVGLVASLALRSVHYPVKRANQRVR